jgi:carboxylesterase type B
MRTDDPNGQALPKWPRFTRETRRQLLFSDAGVAEQTVPSDDICAQQERL